MPFQDLSELVGQLNIADDVIVMDRKIRDLADYFRKVFDDEQTFKQVFLEFNELALNDDNFATNFALFFSSRTIETVFQMASQVRAEMLNILQQNFMNVDQLKQRNPVHFYNSVTLLGEYYNRVRIAGCPVNILGQSLMQLLADQLHDDIDKHLVDAGHTLDERFANLILTQITLNGSLARPNHKSEIENLLFEVRRCLILMQNLSATTKALLLMTIDLYYSNFRNVGEQLEDLYNAYLIMPNPIEAKLSKSDDGQQNTIRTISAISTELSKKSHGLQRPASNAQEFVNRPLKASERLKFVREQCKAKENAEKTSNHAELERVVSEKKDLEETKPASKTTPRKVGLLATPVTPNDESDWLAENAAHIQQLQQTDVSPSEGNPMWIPSPENARNHGNGSPNKYSKSVSPSRGGVDDHRFEQTSRRNRVQNDSSHNNQSAHQLGRSQDRHLDDIQHSKQRMGRGRGRRGNNLKAGGQHGDHRDALYSLHLPGKSNNSFGGRNTFDRNGPNISHDRRPDATQSDDDSEVWEKGLPAEGIYHHSPVAVKYAEEFLEFLDN